MRQVRFSLLCLVFFLFAGVGFSQVGIGNPNPDSTSVLDLSNSANKGLVLPPATSPASFSTTSTLGMTYFSGDNVYYKRSDGYNAMSPWRYRFNGNPSEDVFYNLGGNIGIGVTSLTTSPQAPLQIETVNNIDLATNGSFMLGNTSTTNMVFNDVEIQTRDNGSSAPLQINEDGGNVTFGAPAARVDVATSGKMQEYHQPSATFYDLVPAGTIVMWFGSLGNVPGGWAPCDGGTYTRSDNLGTIVSPDLRGRFVVGAGSNGGSNYAVNDTGGQDSVSLTTAEMPSHNHDITHNHSISDPGHNHNFDLDDSNGGGGVDDAGESNDGSDNTNNAFTGISINTHFGNSGNRGGGDAHENRPAYHALIYIIKL